MRSSSPDSRFRSPSRRSASARRLDRRSAGSETAIVLHRLAAPPLGTVTGRAGMARASRSPIVGAVPEERCPYAAGSTAPISSAASGSVTAGRARRLIAAPKAARAAPAMTASARQGWMGQPRHPHPLRYRLDRSVPGAAPGCGCDKYGCAGIVELSTSRAAAAAASPAFSSIVAALPLEQRGHLARHEAARQPPVGQLPRRPAQLRPERPAAAIAASSGSCGASPASTSRPHGGTPVL